MDSSQLTHEQARRIHDAIGPTVGYLSRLLDRMDKRHFPPDDKLRRLTMPFTGRECPYCHANKEADKAGVVMGIGGTIGFVVGLNLGESISPEREARFIELMSGFGRRE